MTQVEQCDWTDADTEICVRAEASGLAVDASTGNPITFDECKSFAVAFDKIRSSTTVDEFLKGKVNSKPFEF